MSELISAEEARRRSDVGCEEAVAREIGRIKLMIDIATTNGEYYIPLPEGTILHNKTINLLAEKGYRCYCTDGCDHEILEIISWARIK